jgi:hypothetical protein
MEEVPLKNVRSTIVAGCLVAVLGAVASVSAHHAIPGDVVAPKANSHTELPGNPRCPAGSTFFELKLEEGTLTTGVHGWIEITYFDGKYLSWKLTDEGEDEVDADVVIVKGGPKAISYQYSALVNDPQNPSGGPDDDDTRLTAPRNHNGGGQPKYYGISHVQFCFDDKA